MWTFKNWINIVLKGMKAISLEPVPCTKVHVSSPEEIAKRAMKMTGDSMYQAIGSDRHLEHRNGKE